MCVGALVVELPKRRLSYLKVAGSIPERTASRLGRKAGAEKAGGVGNSFPQCERYERCVGRRDELDQTCRCYDRERAVLALRPTQRRGTFS